MIQLKSFMASAHYWAIVQQHIWKLGATIRHHSCSNILSPHVTIADSCDLTLNDTHSRNDAILKTFSSLGQHGCTLSSQWKRNLVCPPDVRAEETYDIISDGGNHSTIGVWSKLNQNVKFVRPGGFIVDDLDVLPDRRSAVERSTQRTDVVRIGRARSKANIFHKRGHSEPIPLLVPTASMTCVCCLYS